VGIQPFALFSTHGLHTRSAARLVLTALLLVAGTGAVMGLPAPAQPRGLPTVLVLAVKTTITRTWWNAARTPSQRSSWSDHP
jgi:hypothetical protein